MKTFKNRFIRTILIVFLMMYFTIYTGTTLMVTATKYHYIEEKQECAIMQFYFGKKYLDELENHEQAVYWFRRAAEQGYARAQYYLAEMYRRGRGVTRNGEYAVYWYTRAAEQGYIRAQNELFFIYQYDIVVARDYELAMYWLRRIAKQGDIEAQNRLALQYSVGRITARDDERAVYWFRRVAEQGDVNAQHRLGRSYQLGIGVTQDYEWAAYWFRMAAEQGHVNAQHSLAGMYLDGIGVTQDYEWAAYWFRMAAEQGHNPSKFSLGLMYFSGGGITPDYESATYWFKKAAEQGHNSSKVSLGLMYFYGRGITPDYESAAYWFRMASTNNHFARQYLSEMYLTGRGVPEDIERAIRYRRPVVTGPFMQFNEHGNLNLTTISDSSEIEVIVDANFVFMLPGQLPPYPNLSPYRFVVRDSYDNLIRMHFIPETRAFLFIVYPDTRFVVEYATDLRRLSMSLDSPYVIDLAQPDMGTIVLDVPPTLYYDNVLVPANFMEILGAEVVYDNESGTVRITLNRRELVLNVGNITEYDNTVAQIIDGHVLVSLQYVAEYFGALVTIEDSGKIEVLR